jgi:adenosylcobinamide-GDP ribazoletransferase
VTVGLDFAFGGLPLGLRNVLLVAFLAGITGGLHYDGLADTCDALGGRHRIERLRILSDSSIGTFGVLGTVLAVALRLACLEALSTANRPQALFLAPVCGRAGLVLAGWGAVAARPNGLGASFVAELEARQVVAAGGSALAAAALVGGSSGVVALVVASLAALGVRRWATRLFGGVTGDVLGAGGEVAENAALVVFAASGGVS